MRRLYNLPLYWQVLLLYLLATLVTFCIVNPVVDTGGLSTILSVRATSLLFLIAAILVGEYTTNSTKEFLQWLLAYSSLAAIYKDTAVLNQIFFNKIDPYLIYLDQKIFGFEPSLEFSKHFSGFFWSEFFFSAYFFYYLFPLIVGFYLFFKDKAKILSFANTLVISFVIYYVVFTLLPACGPQFHLPYPENSVERYGLFGKAVKMIQDGGEAPTAAFPSSHVGISIILMLWIYKNEKKLLKWFIIPVLVLCFSTVYIKAHYAVDVFAGLISGFIIKKILDKWILK